MPEVPSSRVKPCERCGKDVWRTAFRRRRCTQCYRLLCDVCMSLSSCNAPKECKKLSPLGKRVLVDQIVHQVGYCDVGYNGKTARLTFMCLGFKNTSFVHVKKLATKEPLSCIACIADSEPQDVAINVL